MTWRSAAALAAGCAALLWILSTVGVATILHDIRWAGWILPGMTAVHLSQLYLSALAWRCSLGGAGLSAGAIFRARWVREGVNALLPVAQIGGQLAGIAILVRRGVSASLAAAGTILDLTLEAAAQLIFTLAGIGVLFGMRGRGAWLGWVSGGAALTGLAIAGFLLAQRLGLLRLVEGFLERLARRWPAMSAWSMEGLHTHLMRRQADHAAILRALALHSVSWALGSAEAWLALRALGHPVSASDSFVVESLAMAARSAGFAVPGAVGVQEGGFVLVCALFSVPADAALGLSVLKRVREMLVGVPALFARQG